MLLLKNVLRGANMEYYEKMKKLRKEFGFTQKQAADILGVSVGQYGRYERGLSVIGIRKIIALCRYYKVSANYFLDLPQDLKYYEKESR